MFEPCSFNSYYLVGGDAIISDALGIGLVMLVESILLGRLIASELNAEKMAEPSFLSLSLEFYLKS